MTENFEIFLEKNSDTPIAIAVSGGVDSMYLMNRCAGKLNNAVVLTVNHNLRKTAASDTRFVADAAEKIGFKCEVLEWVGAKPETGIEEAARIARYELLTNYCREHGFEILLTAHQSDDQIETFLMNLGRGSGIYGLAGIRKEIFRNGIKIVRPIIDISRAEIEKYCHENKIKFVHDEMNDDENLMRVRVRKNRHLMRDKLGISDDRILLAMKSLDRARSGLENEVERIATQIDSIFSFSVLSELIPELKLKLLSTLITRIGKLNYPPRLQSVQNLLYNLETRASMIMTLGNCTIRRLNDKILIVPEGANISFNKGRTNESKASKRH